MQADFFPRTPGQEAYEKYREPILWAGLADWDNLTPHAQEAWEAYAAKERKGD